MEVTRTSLSSYQGNNKSMPKQVRYAGAAATKGKYGEELRENLSTLGEIRGKAPVIKADAVEAVGSDPNEYTKDAIKTALKKAALALQEGLGKDTTDPTDATISPIDNINKPNKTETIWEYGMKYKNKSKNLKLLCKKLQELTNYITKNTK